MKQTDVQQGGTESKRNRKLRKREQANDRNKAWAALSPIEKLIDLGTRPGECKKQRAKIAKQMEAENGR